MTKLETVKKLERVERRIAKGEPVKRALKAEHMAQATWYGKNGKLKAGGKSARLDRQPPEASKREMLMRQLLREVL